jgi:tRNA nucleotidyltransferase/poly(A) polymerase
MLKRPQLLKGVSGERIRDELFLILGARNVSTSMELLRSSGLLPLIIPGFFQNGESLSSVAGRIAFAAETERLLEDCNRRFPVDREKMLAYLSGPVEGGIPLYSLLKLAAFLSGEDALEQIKVCADRIRLGRKARAELKVLCESATNFPTLQNNTDGQRMLFRFFRDREPGGPELVILPLAARLINPEMAVRLVSYYFCDYCSSDASLLLSGDQVMELLHIGPGRQLGGILAALREAESIGKVSTIAEARDFLLKNQLTTAGQ